MSEEMVRTEVVGRVATVMIHRPERRNALSRAVVESLRERFETLGRDPEVGVIVLTGAGEKAFCAGGDLGDQQTGEGFLAMHEGRAAFAALMVEMGRCEVPIVGRVNGHALGGGFGLALSCDIVVAREGATFGTPEIKVGLFPMMITAVIARNLGRKRAMELMLTGGRVEAAQAVEWGIANKVVEAEALDEAVTEFADKIAGYSPAILRLGRQAFYATQDMGFEQALYTLQSQLTINTLAEDAAEGIGAFFGGRAPEWKGR